MSSFEFDNVKAEKEDALWRYNMEKKFKTGFFLAGFLLALFLLTRFWFPGTLRVAGDFNRRFVSSFNEPLYTFFLLNFIIFVVYILSSQKQATSTDIYDVYVGSSRRTITTSAILTSEESIVDKQIVHVETELEIFEVDRVKVTNISVSPVKQPTTMTNRTVPTKTKPVVCSTEVKEKEYRRTQSMVSESIIQRPVEFGKSKTFIGSCREQSIDEISSEDFQLIIESFIAERKKNLLQENTTIHCTRKRDKCVPILVKS